MSKLWLFIFFAMVVYQAFSHLLTARIITITEQNVILIKNKFKFTDVRMTNSTVSLIQNVKIVSSRDQIPEIPIKAEGRIEQKYYKVNQFLSLYLLRQHMDPQQLSQYFNADHQPFTNQFFILGKQSRNMEVLKGNKRVCFVDLKELESQDLYVTNNIALGIFEQCKEVINNISKEIVKIQNHHNQIAPIFSWPELLGAVVALMTFTALKLGYLAHKCSSQSVV